MLSAIVLLSAIGAPPRYDVTPAPRYEVEAAMTPALPAGAVKYQSAQWTQSIGQRANGFNAPFFPFIERVRIRDLSDKRWHQPGGLQGVDGWTADKYRTLPDGERVRVWLGGIAVLNSFGNYQTERGILRRYPDGTRFDEVLKNEDGEVFEHRVREKHDGKWESDIIYKNPSARPDGYMPVSLTQCASCHGEAGTGKYAEGLVPGGDQVLSDPLDWSLVGAEAEAAPTKPAPKPTYAEVYARVMRGERVQWTHDGSDPAAPASIPLGKYDCYLSGGFPVIEPCRT